MIIPAYCSSAAAAAPFDVQSKRSGSVERLEGDDAENCATAAVHIQDPGAVAVTYNAAEQYTT
jgi:hypothetical protein